MTCDAPSLAQASRCLCGFSRNEVEAAEIYLLCAWANVAGIPLPDIVSTPSPSDAAIGVDGITLTLTWVGGANTTSYDVWFDGVFIGNQAGASYSPGILAGSTTFTWRIDAVGPGGTTTGPTWSFTTTVLSGLLGWWKMDEGILGATVINSASPGFYDGTPVNTPAYVAGVVGPYSLDFDGINQEVTLSFVPTSRPISFSFWRKRIWEVNHVIWSANVFNTNLLIYDRAGNYMSLYVSATDEYGFVNPVPADTGWHHVVFTIGAAGARLAYWDGAPIAISNLSGASSNPHTTASMRFARANGYGAYFGGALDDMRIYDRVLTPAEVASLFSEGTP